MWALLISPALAVPIVTTDPRVALVSVAMRLSQAEAYSKSTGPYADAVDKHFGPHAEHHLIDLIGTLREQDDIAYDAPMSLALHLDDQLRPPTLRPWPPQLDERWRPRTVRRTARALRKFRHDTAFDAFWETQAAYRSEVIATYSATLPITQALVWLTQTFSAPMPDDVRVIPGLLNHHSSYGLSVDLGKGRLALRPVLGVTEQPPDLDDALTLVHEYAHAFINPVFGAHATDFGDLGERLLERDSETLSRQGYETPMTVLNETGVRAATLQYALVHHGEKVACELLRREEERGWRWLDLVAPLIDGAAPLEDSIPPIVEALHTWEKAPVDDRFMGPINAAVASPDLLIVAPDGPQHRYVRSVYDHFWAEQGAELQISVDLPEVPRGLVLYGSPTTNPALAQMLERLDWEVTETFVRKEGVKTDGERLVLIATTSHPDDGSLPVLVYAAADDTWIEDIHSVTHGPTDWVMAQYASGAFIEVSRGSHTPSSGSFPDGCR